MSRSLFRPEVKGPAELLPASGMVCPESQEENASARGNEGASARKIRPLLFAGEIRLQSVCHRIMRNLGV